MLLLNTLTITGPTPVVETTIRNLNIEGDFIFPAHYARLGSFNVPRVYMPVPKNTPSKFGDEHRAVFEFSAVSTDTLIALAKTIARQHPTLHLRLTYAQATTGQMLEELDVHALEWAHGTDRELFSGGVSHANFYSAWLAILGDKTIDKEVMLYAMAATKEKDTEHGYDGRAVPATADGGARAEQHQD